MIINSIIAGAGTGGIELKYKSITPTSNLNLAQLFSGFDYTCYYKNSVIIVYNVDNTIAGISKPVYMMMFAHIGTAIQANSNYGLQTLARTSGTSNMTWTDMCWNTTVKTGYGSSISIDANGKISATTPTGLSSSVCGVNGANVTLIEIPYHTTKCEIDDTLWGAT